MARIQMAPTTCAEMQREFSGGNNQKTTAIEAAMMWIYDKERLGMHRKHILKTNLWNYNGGARAENIHKNHKDHGKTGILKVIEDSRLELWEFWTRRNGYFDPSHGGVKPAASQAKLAPRMECCRDSLCLTGITWYKKPGKINTGIARCKSCDTFDTLYQEFSIPLWF